MRRIWKSGWFLCRLWGLLLKTGFAFNENILKLFAKSASKPLRLATAAAATDAAIHKKIIGSGIAILIIWKWEMYDIMKIVKSLEEFGLLIKGVRKTIKNELKEQKRDFS